MEIARRKAAKGLWVEWAGRTGLVAKGAIYALVGVLMVALGFGGRPEDRQGALRFIADQPLGEVILFALAAGFAGYAVWRLARMVVFGLDGALAKVAQATYGEWLLAVVAGGLLAYGLFCFMQARYREV